MDDRFLYEQRPTLRPGFGEDLYARLSGMTAEERIPYRGFKFAVRLALACVLLFVLVLAFSKPVRADVLRLIKNIAGFNVAESTAAPVIDQAKVTIYYTTPQKNLSFAFSMPAYIPEGFALEKDAVTTDSLAWAGRGGEIFLMVQQDWNITIETGVDSAKEVTINGQPGVLIKGGWDWDGSTWNPDKKMLQLYWRKDGLLYILQAYDPTLFKEVLTEDEIIKIAESTK